MLPPVSWDRGVSEADPNLDTATTTGISLTHPSSSPPVPGELPITPAPWGVQ